MLPTSWDGMLKTTGLRERDCNESGTVVRARMWLAPNFPLNASHFLLLLDIIAVASRRVRKAQAALNQWQMRDAFPIKLHIPLLITVWAQISCTAYKPLDPASVPPGWFGVPAEYERCTADPESMIPGNLG